MPQLSPHDLLGLVLLLYVLLFLISISFTNIYNPSNNLTPMHHKTYNSGAFLMIF
uniref:ATP synthase subunit 8 n=1 Tax=Camaena cicatricosa TaxID=1550735 RepID=A0A0A0QNJ3_CAMCI|nr:ATP synthase F0 subunit 8 [Camaena cicatricosa]AIS20796.1 ATP synthase subunit 8 [Camaena cicatricosa]